MTASRVHVEVRQRSDEALAAGPPLQDLRNRVSDVGAGLVSVADGLRDQLAGALGEAGTGSWILNEVEVTLHLDLESVAGGVVVRRQGDGDVAFVAKLTLTRRSGSDGAAGVAAGRTRPWRKRLGKARRGAMTVAN